MKNNIDINLTKANKTVIYIELSLLAVISIFTIIEIILIFGVSNVVSDVYDQQHYNFINHQFNIQKYVADIKLVTNKKYCSDIGYDLLSFLEIQNIKNAKLSNISDTVKLRDFHVPDNILNTTFRLIDVFNFDISEAGSEYIQLLHKYAFNKWKGFYICELKMLLDDEAIFINEAVKKCENKDDFPMIDCGNIYDNKYKICLRKDKIKFNKNHTKVDDDLKLKNSSLSNEEFAIKYCPITKLIVSPNKEKEKENSVIYKDFQLINTYYIPPPNVNIYIDWPTYGNFDDKDPKKNEISEDNINSSKDNESKNLNTNIKNENDYFNIQYLKFNQNNTLNYYTKIDRIVSNKYLFNPDPLAKIIQYLPANSTTLPIGDNFTIVDSYTKIEDEQSFLQLYNFTFFNKSAIETFNETIENTTKTVTNYYFNPEPLSNINLTQYYLPIDSNNTEKFSLVSITTPLASESFINKTIKNQPILEFSKYFEGLDLGIVEELLDTLKAWLFIKLFVLYFYEFKIRVTVLLDYLSNTVSVPDYESEKTSKFISKFLLIFVYVVIIFSLIYEGNKSNLTVSRIDYIINNNAFPNEYYLNSILEAYGNFMKEINKKVFVVLALIIVSLVLQALISILFSINKFEKKIPEVEVDHHEEHHKLKHE